MLPKYFLIGAIFGFILLSVYVATQPDGRLHVIFCDVGQGDAIYLKMPNGTDMLIDGGPNDKVLSCLGRFMPFYDRQIDMVVLTHPQKDHLQGLLSVLERFSLKHFVLGVESNDSEGYRRLVSLLNERKISFKYLYQGDYFNMGNVRFNVLWPNKKWVEGKAVLGLTTDSELNDFSYYLYLQYGNFDALFTGDGDSRIQDEIMETASLPDIELLKFPHHGSKTGISGSFLDLIKPESAVISSGKNPWGHPTKEALDLLSERNINIFRTDRTGDIEVKTDGINWTVDK